MATPSPAGGGSSPNPQATERAISHRVAFELPHCSTRPMAPDVQSPDAAACAPSPVGNRSGQAEGSSTSWANSTARHAASGRRAHHRCKVEGWPCRIDFSFTEAALIASNGMRLRSASCAATWSCGVGQFLNGFVCAQVVKWDVQPFAFHQALVDQHGSDHPLGDMKISSGSRDVLIGGIVDPKERHESRSWAE